MYCRILCYFAFFLPAASPLEFRAPTPKHCLEPANSPASYARYWCTHVSCAWAWPYQPSLCVFSANQAWKGFEGWACQRTGKQGAGNATSFTKAKIGQSLKGSTGKVGAHQGTKPFIRLNYPFLSSNLVAGTATYPAIQTGLNWSGEFQGLVPSRCTVRTTSPLRPANEIMGAFF